MIRIHQVLTNFPLSPNKDKEENAYRIMYAEEIASVFRRFEKDVERTSENLTTETSECERMRSSANYVIYHLDSIQIDPVGLIDLVQDLIARPKRTIIAICSMNACSPLSESVTKMYAHLQKKFPSGDFTYLNSVSEVASFIESKLNNKPVEN